ncbi:unnamed protein product [Euphydryas editha]|uniref:Reverse transcriptase domain-containing protein n=1 Tax=Euphydryas editha TaxID=104508 RepID=A0AAU9V8J0_EUPED|nr:unnamed protein product [Euphydryas editha]
MKSITTSCDASMPLKELKNAAMTLKLGKAPGPKGIPTLVIKTTTQDFPDLILNACNACLATGTFATVWKRQRLVLLDKGKGTPLTPSSFRPLCMLDTAGKLLEKLIQAKLRSDIGSVGGFAESQHGLRKRRSTIGAIKKDERLVQSTIDAVTTWLEKHQQRLAKHKTEMVVLIRQKWFPKPFNVDIGETTLTSTRALRYLEVMIDEKLSFREHHESACTKANKTVSSLSRIMTNTMGPRTQKTSLFSPRLSPLNPALWSGNMGGYPETKDLPA